MPMIARFRYFSAIEIVPSRGVKLGDVNADEDKSFSTEINQSVRSGLSDQLKI